MPQPKKEKKTEPAQPVSFTVKNAALWVTAIYCLISIIITFPLIFKMRGSVYGPYDHITTDMFSVIAISFWWVKTAILNLHVSPLITQLTSAPFGSQIVYTNLTGFVLLPFTAVFGPVFSYNLAILINFILAGLGMYMLVKYITKSGFAGFIAGIIFAFCPNMAVRSYTTFDSTQVMWIPFYTLYLIKFIDTKAWKDIILAGIFLICNIIFSFPYYLVYLPMHTIVVLITSFIWHFFSVKKSFSEYTKGFFSKQALNAWIKTAVVFAGVLVVFALDYGIFLGGSQYVSNVQRTEQDLRELSEAPSDYLMPHPRSAILKGNIKESYWNQKRPGKDPDSFVAYTGYAALILALYGLIKGRRSSYKWIFLATAAVAFWATLGPELFGLPTPSGIIYWLYAHFARRILIYKVFVQMGIAVLGGIGIALIIEKLEKPFSRITLAGIISVIILAEYLIVPPALSVNLSETPEIYKKVKELPANSVIAEIPLKRNNGNTYQGYYYYQMYHMKNLFNPGYGMAKVPENLRQFYAQMEVPIEAQDYANIQALRFLGITHIIYHRYIGTNTVVFRSFAAPGFSEGRIDGLKQIYADTHDPRSDTFTSPFDYTFADLYEIEATESPVALVFDYKSPYEQVPGLLQQDFPTQFGWASSLIDTTKTFYYPVSDSTRIVRLLRQGGKISAVNLSDKPIKFSLSFLAESADNARPIDIKWNETETKGSFMISPSPVKIDIRGLEIEPGKTGVISIWSGKGSFKWPLDTPLGKANIPVMAVLSDFRTALE